MSMYERLSCIVGPTKRGARVQQTGVSHCGGERGGARRRQHGVHGGQDGDQRDPQLLRPWGDRRGGRVEQTR